MSGEKRRLIYSIADLFLYAAAATADVLIFLYTGPKPSGAAEYFAVSAFLLSLILGLPALVHELGHLLFGTLSGMKLAGFHFRPLSRSASSSEMFPKKSAHVRGKFLCFAVGGAALNLSVGILFLILYFAMKYSPALLFFALFAPFSIYEGLRALLPAELSAGKTDGAVIRGILKKSAEEEIALRVLTAQAVLYRHGFGSVSEDLLYDVPVVREDLPAYFALLFLRMQFEIFHEDPRAEKSYQRLKDLDEYFSEAQKKELRYYGQLFGEENSENAKKDPLYGVRELKQQISERYKKEN